MVTWSQRHMRVVPTALALTSALTLGGCSLTEHDPSSKVEQTISRSSLVGGWVATSAEDHSGNLTLTSDGTWSATQFPTALFDAPSSEESVSQSPLSSLGGTWEAVGDLETNQTPYLLLTWGSGDDLPPGMSRSTQLWIDTSSAPFSLFIIVGSIDDGDRYLFRRFEP